MDSLDREIAEAFAEQPLPEGPSRILIVGGGRDLQEALVTKLADRGHGCESVGRLDEAHRAVARGPKGRGRFDLVL